MERIKKTAKANVLQDSVRLMIHSEGLCHVVSMMKIVQVNAIVICAGVTRQPEELFHVETMKRNVPATVLEDFAKPYFQSKELYLVD